MIFFKFPAVIVSSQYSVDGSYTSVKPTGCWQPVDRAWSPLEDLLRFLDGGSPPVFIGVGSLPIYDPQSTARLVVEAV